MPEPVPQEEPGPATPRRAGVRVRVRREPMLAASLLMLALLASVAAVPQAFTSGDPRACDLARSRETPSLAHPFGFDTLGCDYLVQTVYGARTSLSVAGLTLVATVVVALVLGGMAGYRGGWADVLVSRAADAWAAIPLLLGGVVVLTATERRGVLEVSLVLAIFGWPAMVRLVRGSVRTAASRDHVLAARALGAGPWRILRRHVLPNSVRPLLVYASAFAGVVVAAEATLTYIGTGLQQPTESWGLMLLRSQDRITQAPHLMVFPALALVFTVLAFVLLGEALRRRSPPDA
ncbi:MAG TPA: ABC transporter permease [Jiangellales bacterium]|nr:ABC transporter permease [Jiangellales bacterium]